MSPLFAGILAVFAVLLASVLFWLGLACVHWQYMQITMQLLSGKKPTSAMALRVFLTIMGISVLTALVVMMALRLFGIAFG